jgi:hypothetical protein
VNAEFNWWLLIVGLVIGAGLVWLILADSTRREADVEEQELADEALWIAAELRESGRPVDRELVAEVLRHHRAYLAEPPPDDPDDDGWDDAAAFADGPGRPQRGDRGHRGDRDDLIDEVATGSRR